MWGSGLGAGAHVLDDDEAVALEGRRGLLRVALLRRVDDVVLHPRHPGARLELRPQRHHLCVVVLELALPAE